MLVDEDQDEDNDEYEQNGDGDGECQQRTLALLFPCTALSHSVLQWQQAAHAAVNLLRNIKAGVRQTCKV